MRTFYGTKEEVEEQVASHRWAALSEGMCWWCETPLSPVEPSSPEMKVSGICNVHGLFELDAEEWHYTTPFGLGWNRS